MGMTPAQFFLVLPHVSIAPLVLGSGYFLVPFVLLVSA